MGSKVKTDWLIYWLRNPQAYLPKALMPRYGWSDEDLRKLAGENIMRVLDQAQAVAARLQKTRPPSTKTIAELDGPKVPRSSSR